MGTGYSTPVRHSFLPFYRHPPSSIQLTANEQIVAGIVALLNDYRISQGEPKLGFLKPWLFGDGLEASTTLNLAKTRAVELMGPPLSRGGMLWILPDWCLLIFDVGLLWRLGSRVSIS